MNKLQYTFFSGGHAQTTGGKVRTATFQELYSEFSKVESGTKDGSYIVRGALTIDKRKDENIPSSELLIIDADAGDENGATASDPELLHNFLRQRDISHFIYTSHSHTAKKNRYRAVIHCDMQNRAALKPALASIFEDIEENNKLTPQADNILIVDADENSTWSQPWYLPRRKDATDGLFRHFKHFGEMYVPHAVKPKVKPEAQATKAPLVEKTFSMEEHEAAIIAFKEGSGVHDHIIRLALLLVGIRRQTSADAKAYLRKALDKCSPEAKATPRWEERYKLDVESAVDSAVVKCNEQREASYELTLAAENDEYELSQSLGCGSTRRELKDPRKYRDIAPDLGAVDFREMGTDEVAMVTTVPKMDFEISGEEGIPMPPGPLGDFIRCAYHYETFKYPKLALATVLGFLAGVCGRAYNIEGSKLLGFRPSGLNLFITLMGDTGVGKDTMAGYFGFLTRIFMMNAHIDVNLFYGPANFTGPKAVSNVLVNKRSCLCLIKEAGMAFDSTAGDKNGMHRLFTDLYTRSWSKEIAPGEEYSTAETSMGALNAPALSLLLDSTAEALRGYMNSDNTMEKGFTPRNSIFELPEEMPDGGCAYNLMTDELHSRLTDILTKATDNITKTRALETADATGDDTDALAKPEVTMVRYAPGVLVKVAAHRSKMISIRNSYKHDDPARSAMASRMNHKAVKFAGACAAFNAPVPVVTEEIWAWAEALIDFEFAALDGYFRSGNSINSVVEKAVVPQVYKILCNQFKGNDRIKQTEEMFKARVIKVSALRQALNNNQKLKKWDDGPESFNCRTGYQKVIDHLTKTKMIDLTSDKCYRITPAFVTVIQRIQGRLKYRK